MPWQVSPYIHLKDFPSAKGSYLLGLYLDTPTEMLFSKHGLVFLHSGTYLYFGSAHGSGGIQGRMRHHLREGIAPHWHIDWLRVKAVLGCVFFLASEKPLECNWFQQVDGQHDFRAPVAGFGSSDCKNGCKAHLLYRPGPCMPVHQLVHIETLGELGNGVQWEG